MKIQVTATFEINLGKCSKEEAKTYLEDFYDYSVFMPQCEYKNLKNVKVKQLK